MSEKKKYELEYMIKTSSKILYNLVATPSGLSEWFADNVNIKDGIYSFVWDGEEEKARLNSKKVGEFIRWQWLEDEEDELETYFEIKMHTIPSDPKMILLTIIDFTEEDEIEESQMLWEKQIDGLKRILGA